jgi:hypothetical protein
MSTKHKYCNLQKKNLNDEQWKMADILEICPCSSMCEVQDKHNTAPVSAYGSALNMDAVVQV